MYRLFKNITNSINNFKYIKYGVVANTAFGIIIRANGDVIQQKIEQTNKNQSNEETIKKIDWNRTSLSRFRKII